MPGNWRIFKLTELTRRCIFVGRANGEEGRREEETIGEKRVIKREMKWQELETGEVRRTKFL